MIFSITSCKDKSVKIYYEDDVKILQLPHYQLANLKSDDSGVNGMVVSRFGNEQIESITIYEHGIITYRISWYSNGKIQSELHRKDVIVTDTNMEFYGITDKWYHENGQIESEKIYQNGKLIQTQEWDENGKSK